MGKFNSSDSCSQLEAAIRAAGDYVHPSDDLRPRTIESAQERHSISRGQSRLALVTIAVVLALTIRTLGLVHESLFAPPNPAKSIAASSTEDRSWQGDREQVIHGEFTSTWGLFEAFLDLRRAQARRFGTSRENSLDN